MDKEDEYIQECEAYYEKPKPGRRVAQGARSVHDLLDQMVKASPEYQVYREQEVVVRWAEIAGDRVAASVQAVDVQNGELLLRTSVAVWKTEMMALKPQLIRKCNELFGRGLIRNIRFV